MPERLECEVLQKERCTNTLTFTFTCALLHLGITRYLLFASRQAIRGVSLDSNADGLTPPEAIPPIVGADSIFVAVDCDATDNYVYYSDIRKNSIHRIHTNGTGRLSFVAYCSGNCSFNLVMAWAVGGER